MNSTLEQIQHQERKLIPLTEKVLPLSLIHDIQIVRESGGNTEIEGVEAARHDLITEQANLEARQMAIRKEIELLESQLRHIQDEKEKKITRWKESPQRTGEVREGAKSDSELELRQILTNKNGDSRSIESRLNEIAHSLEALNPKTRIPIITVQKQEIEEKGHLPWKLYDHEGKEIKGANQGTDVIITRHQSVNGHEELQAVPLPLDNAGKEITGQMITDYLKDSGNGTKGEVYLLFHYQARETRQGQIVWGLTPYELRNEEARNFNLAVTQPKRDESEKNLALQRFTAQAVSR